MDRRSYNRADGLSPGQRQLLQAAVRFFDDPIPAFPLAHFNNFPVQRMLRMRYPHQPAILRLVGCFLLRIIRLGLTIQAGIWLVNVDKMGPNVEMTMVGVHYRQFQ